jgi:hypothetical protein
MVKAELPSDAVPHERTRFLAAALHTSDLAAVELYKSLTDEGRSEVAGMLHEVRSRVGKLKEKNAARLAAGEETQEGA